MVGSSSVGVEAKEPPAWNSPTAAADKQHDQTHQPPVRALQACFFVLGMGLQAAANSIWQCMDYMNNAYAGLHPSRVLSTHYNTLYAVLLFGLFFGGPRLWPNKQRRMMTGYGLYVLALVVPPLVDILAHRLAPPGSNLRPLMASWALSAAVAGAGDALISSVVYVEASALGPAYTHGFFAGKAACGLLMAGLRCASKAALPGTDSSSLRLGTAVFLAAGALLVAACVVIVAVVLPRLTAGPAMMAAVQEAPGLTVQQTLTASHSIALGHPSPPDSPQPALLAHTNTLAGMVPGMAGAILNPAFSASFKHSGTGSGHSVKLSPVDTRVEVPTSWLSVTRSLASARCGSQCRYSIRTGTNSPLQTQAITETSCVLGEGLTGLENGQDASAARSHDETPAASPDLDDVGNPRCAPDSVSQRNWSRRSLSKQLRSDSFVIIPVGRARFSGSFSRSRPAEADGGRSLDFESPFAAAAMNQHRPKPKASGDASGNTNASDWTIQVQEQPLDAHADLAKESQANPSLLDSLHAVWCIMKVFCPFQLAVFIPPLITAAILPMLFGLDFSTTALGSWYVQVTAVTYQLGAFVGSGLIPVPARLAHPKATLLAASLSMGAFVAAFACSLKLGGGPGAMIALAFVMYMCSGYLTSCIFCLAGMGLPADDAQMLQMLLVLSTAVSVVLGGCISWAWLAVPKA